MGKLLTVIIFSLMIVSCKYREHGLTQEGSLQTLICFQDTASLMKLTEIKAVGSEKHISFSIDSVEIQPHYLGNDSMPRIVSEIALDANNNGVIYYFYSDEIDTLKLSYSRSFKYESQYELYYGNISITGHTFKKATLKNRFSGDTIDRGNDFYALVLEIEK